MADQQVGGDARVPAWLLEDPCPRWCAGDHPIGEHSLDRVHAAPVVLIPLIEDNGRPSMQKRPTGAEYVIDIRRYPGRPETWVYVGNDASPGRGFCLTLESAARLQWELGAALAAAFGDWG